MLSSEPWQPRVLNTLFGHVLPQEAVQRITRLIEQRRDATVFAIRLSHILTGEDRVHGPLIIRMFYMHPDEFEPAWKYYLTWCARNETGQAGNEDDSFHFFAVMPRTEADTIHQKLLKTLEDLLQRDIITKLAAFLCPAYEDDAVSVERFCFTLGNALLSLGVEKEKQNMVFERVAAALTEHATVYYFVLAFKAYLTTGQEHESE